jgi:cyanophycinase-like exopeptidase
VDAVSSRVLLKTSKVIFSTGGDQVRITSMLGGSPMCDEIRKAYEADATLAGTSAGASCMSETMLVSGSGEQSHKVEHALLIARPRAGDERHHRPALHRTGRGVAVMRTVPCSSRAQA